MPSIQCFWLEPVDRERRWLRRWAGRGSSPCTAPPPNHGYHQARAVIEDGPIGQALDVGFYEADPRWPARCACGYAFEPDDHYQVFSSPLYRRQDTGELMTWEDAPPGAMMDAKWLGQLALGNDGVHLYVKTPGGDWMVDGPAKDGGRWTRTGDPRALPPTVTAEPSIDAGPRYHGWLRQGVLVDA